MALAKTTSRGAATGRRHEHITIEEREEMTVGRREGKSIRATAGEIGRGPSTVKREPGRNSPGGGRRRASAARRRGDARRLRRRRRGRLGDPALRSLAQARVLPGQRSPGRVAGRLALGRGRRAVSGPATRRAIARRGPGAPEPRRTARGPAGRLRHRGRRRRRGEGGRRGRFPIPHEIRGRPAPTATPDRGKEFADWDRAAREAGAGSCFCAAHRPRERGAVENTSGLIREHLPKGTDFSLVTDGEVAEACDGTSRRPRERLGWRTPQEAHYSEALHLL